MAHVAGGKTHRLQIARIKPMPLRRSEGRSPSLDLASAPEAALTFNDLLRKAGIDPGEVRLLRHQDASADPGRSPFALWRTDPAAFVELPGPPAPRPADGGVQA